MFLLNVECPCGLNFSTNHKESDLEVCIECSAFESCMGSDSVLIDNEDGEDDGEEDEDLKIPYKRMGF